MAIHIFFLPSQTKGASIITATITVTNTAGVGTNWIVNGNSRTWTNNTGTPPGSWIQVTNGAGPTASNLYNSIVRFPYLSPFLSISRTGTNTFTLRGTTLVITTNNYFSVSYQTNIGTNLTVIQVPFENVPGTTNWTNNAHWLVDALNRYPYTNSLATNANVLSNALIKGAAPYQEILGPIGFRGRFAALSNFFATNGFTRSLTNINPVSSNAVNFGNAFRSEGSGGNSLQLGSNASATATRAIAVGNSAVSSATDGISAGTLATNTGTGGSVVGNTAYVNGDYGASFGFQAGATNYGSAFGAVSLASGLNSSSFGRASAATMENASAFGDETEASAYNATVFGANGLANKINAAAFGPGAGAIHSNSAAIGPPDHLGNVVATTSTNQIFLGTANHRIFSPGLYESPLGTNSQFAGTNIVRGSWSFPRFDMTTLAAGNNISVPAGTNVYIRVGAGPVSAAAICGIIGGATSGGLDGQELAWFNDTGFSLTFAINTVDPVARNRINSALGLDVTIPDQGWAFMRYDDVDERWKLHGTFPMQASATNFPDLVWTNDNDDIRPNITHYAISIRTNRDELLSVGNNHTVDGPGLLFLDAGAMAIEGFVAKTSGSLIAGEAAGLMGAGIGDYSLQYGAIGMTYARVHSGGTNVGVAGISLRYGIANVPIGGYFSVAVDDSQQPNLESSSLLVDNWTTGTPLIIARTNNGTFKAFEVHGTKTTNATPLDVLGLTTLYGNWRVPDTNGLGGFISFTASTNSGSAVLTVSGSPGSSTVRTNGNGFVFNTPGASDFSFVKGVTSNLTILGVATLNITNGIIMGISGP